jgi:hypothetical protein
VRISGLLIQLCGRRQHFVHNVISAKSFVFR